MTEKERSNEQILNLVDEQVSRVEAEFDRLAKLEQSLDAARATAGKLALESKRIRDNVDGLSKSKRVGLLQNAAANIALEENDALMIERSIAASKAHVIALGQAAKSSGSEILWALATTRRSNAKAKLEEILDFSVVGVGQNLETAARSVLELKDLQYYFAHSTTAHEADYQLALLHQLRTHFSQLRAWCENELSLIIPAITLTKPAEVAVEYEPAATTNRLGVLAEPVMA